MQSYEDQFKPKFEKAAEDVKNLKKRPSNNELLELYSLYKQVTIGDNNTPSPSMFNFEKNEKWKAWNNKKGLSKLNAMIKYVNTVEELKKRYM